MRARERVMRSYARAALWAAAVVGVGACGGPVVEHETVEVRRTSGDERPRRRDDGAQITGLMGTIAREQVERALNPRMPRLMRCFEQRLGAVEVLAGNMRFGFRIHTDGTVAWVYPAETDIGDRQTEQCVLEVARSTRFPPPRGGEAEFSWSFGLDAAEDVRPPLNWSADALGPRMADVGTVARECGVSGSYAVTAYVEPGGRVLAAGGSAPSAEGEPALDCILERVRAWTMPDPGSYAAKITFTVQ